MRVGKLSSMHAQDDLAAMTADRDHQLLNLDDSMLQCAELSRNLQVTRACKL